MTINHPPSSLCEKKIDEEEEEEEEEEEKEEEQRGVKIRKACPHWELLKFPVSSLSLRSDNSVGKSTLSKSFAVNVPGSNFDKVPARSFDKVRIR